jgi:hypothetical protein
LENAALPLAFWRGTAGDPATAANELELVIEGILRVLGPAHPDTLQAQQDLVRWREEAGEDGSAVG